MRKYIRYIITYPMISKQKIVLDILLDSFYDNPTKRICLETSKQEKFKFYKDLAFNIYKFSMCQLLPQSI